MIDKLEKVANWQDFNLFEKDQTFSAFKSIDKKNDNNVCNGVIIIDNNQNYDDYIFISSKDIINAKKIILNRLYNLKYISNTFIYNNKEYTANIQQIKTLEIAEKILCGKIDIIYKLGNTKMLKSNDNFYFYLEYKTIFKEK